MKKSRSILLVAILGGLLVAGPPANLVALGPAPYPTGTVSFETYRPEPGVVRIGEAVRYQASWNGINAAEARFEVRADPNRPGWICAAAAGKTIGQAAALYRAEDSLSSCMNAADLKPDLYTIRIRETLDNYDMWVKFNFTAKIAERKKKTPKKETAKTFKFLNAYCPLSAFLLIRSLSWKPGDERRFEVIDGNDRYLLVIKALNYEQVQVPAGTFRAIRLQPSIFVLRSDGLREGPRYWQRQQAKDRTRLSLMKAFSLWMMADPPRQILKVRTDVYFGHVELNLMELKVPDRIF